MTEIVLLGCHMMSQTVMLGYSKVKGHLFETYQTVL